MPHTVDPDLTDVFVKIYMSLREYTLLSGNGPSKQQLARSCKCSVTSVYKAEKMLKRKGYITSTKDEIRGMRPTDLTRTLSRELLDPWAELDDDKPVYWRT